MAVPSPSITVLLPARDAADTVEAAARCVLTQTFKDLELVAIDDGSADATRAVLERLADPRVRILDGGGKGLVHALELGRREARAPFIARMDADDECHPERLASSLAALAADPSLSGVGTQVEIFRDDQPVSPNLAAYGQWLNSLVTPERLFRDRFVESPLCHGSVLLRRDALDAAGGWTDGPYPEDWELWLRLLESGRRLSVVPRVLYRWRDRDRRLTRTDPRYARDKHLALKARFLAARHRQLAIAGAGKTGLELSRLLRGHGVHITRFIDVNPKKIGQRLEGIPVIAPETVGGPDGVHLIAAAGSKGARAEIRALLLAHDWREGDDFTCAA